MMLELEGETLGKKHQEYNKILEQFLKTNTSPDGLVGAIDVKNLLKIDIASHNRDVDYILETLKSDDMLYVSRALSKCTWLITDQEYAHIINPEYLQTNLYPNMTPKAAIKLKKHIQHHIKDETRAEQFYLSETKDSDAIKWLPYCSVSFIASKVVEYIQSHNVIDLRLFKRLCEKSISIFEVVFENSPKYERERYLKPATFLLNTDIDKFLHIIEKNEHSFGYGFKLSHKATALIMEHSTNRVIDNIEKYISSLHIPTFAKYMTPDQVTTFLYTQAKKDLRDYEFLSLRNLFHIDTLKYFIRRLPINEQFEFVKNVCMGKQIEDLDKEIESSDTEVARFMKLCYTNNPKQYVWYEFAPFEIAFKEITKLYPLTSSNEEKHKMLFVLIKCAGHNLQQIQDILNFYNKRTKEDSDGKCQLVSEILEHTHICKYDEKTWNMLNELLKSAKIYESNDISGYVQIINSIIIYNALSGHKTPEVIEKMFSFDTLKSYRSKMDQEQQNKVFQYLYDYLLPQLKDQINDEKDLKDSISVLENILKLINDWEKPFLDYPFILNKIKELVKLKKEKSWKTNLSSLYNVNKSWRRHMFEESPALCPNEEMCLNALRHEPQLLARHTDELTALRNDDSVSLHRLHRKIRIYWPDSLARQWIENYINNLDKANGLKTAVQGLCTILAQKPLLEILELYKPVDAKIDWKKIEEGVLNAQRLFAKHMHISRPQPSPDSILLYAKGDYLQFALPSLLAIFYNLKPVLNKEQIPKLLVAPVSVQKHGIRLAFKKLDREDLKKIFLDCWTSSKNVSIRAIIFKYTFALLCSETDDAKAISLWELLELFIDNLTFTEDKETYKLFTEVDKVPLIVRAKFLVKSYEFLQKLLVTLDKNSLETYEWYCVTLADHTREVMETINKDFVLKIIREFVEHDFINGKCKYARRITYSGGIVSVISAYVLCTTSEHEQIERYEQVIVPLMQRAFDEWDKKRNGEYFIRHNFQHLLTRLSLDLKEYVTEKKKIIPLNMFSLIQTELDKNLKVSENYLMLTKWKLTVALATLAVQYSSTDDLWYDKCGPEFGKICLEYLKTDVTTHFPCIYVLFSKSAKNIMESYIQDENARLKFFENILSDKDFIQGYLTAIEMSADFRSDDAYKPVHMQIFSHPSVEVKMHYYNKIDKKRI